MSFYKKLATVFALSLSAFSFTQAAPASSIFPRGCELSGFAFDKNFLILNETGKQTFYLMQNHSNQTIESEHYETRADVFMSPKMEAKLGPSHWSAFASDEANLYFQCFVHQKNERIAINCGDVLDICQYPRVKFALSNQGNYWVSTDKTRQQVITDATAKGIFLHW
ncbi:MAG TPA: enhanced entry protein EnhB [Legionellaceae bacterium]|nr:enhanced entry protein EnhB [Legionellaceae bacterium]